MVRTALNLLPRSPAVSFNSLDNNHFLRLPTRTTKLGVVTVLSGR